MEEIKHNFILPIGKYPYLGYGWAEEYVSELYRKKGYNVKALHSEVGQPDLYVWDAQEHFWVEVKREHGLVRQSQKDWMTNNKSERVIIFRIFLNRKMV